MKKLFKYLSVVLLTVCFLGCKPSLTPSSNYKVIGGEDIVNFIVYTNNIKSLGCTLMVDTDYAIPTESWIKTSFTRSYKQFLFDYHLNIPSEVDNDCDDFVFYGVTTGKITHRLSKLKPKNTSLAIGEFYFMNGVNPHAIIFFVAMDEFGNLKLVFYEPQYQQIIPLNPSEVGVLHWKI